MYKIIKNNMIIDKVDTALKAARLINKYTDESYGLISSDDIKVKARSLRNGKTVKENTITIIKD